MSHERDYCITLIIKKIDVLIEKASPLRRKLLAHQKKLNKLHQKVQKKIYLIENKD